MANGENRKEKNIFRESFEEIKAYFKDFRFDKPHMKAALPFFIEILLFAFIITFDLTMKDYLYDFVVNRNGGYYTVVEGFFALNYSENTGMGFGLGQDSTTGITVMTCIVIVVVIGYLAVFRKDKAYIRIPLVMVAAGGIGNLVDRIALGYVRDFFEFTFMDFAIFNIADSFVTVGAIALIIGLIVMMAATAKDEKVRQAAEEAEGGEAPAENAEKSAESSAENSSEGTEEPAESEAESAEGAGENKTESAESSAESTAENAAEGAENSAENAVEGEAEGAEGAADEPERAKFTVEKTSAAFTVTRADDGEDDK